MKDGDFVRIEYVGTLKESGVVFEVTNAEEAKKRGLYNPQNKYGTLPVIIGGSFVIKGLEKALKEMKVGDKKTVSVKAEEGFGDRNSKLVKIFPEAEFHKQNMVPYQGMPVSINNMMGRVMSTSGGRVKVDFNHPLAGKELTYELDLKEVLTKPEDKVKAVAEFYFEALKDEEVKINGGNVEIISESFKKASPNTKKLIANAIIKWVGGMEVVKFSEEYRKEEK